ncbi:MAG: type II toxin-antitoxin system RelB/DinJ family antitoxin [Defluviitaleaceae bacterium]|nr:type II toxin-antitoxin system RelB/DinJ family antitoxin [Defluviitaleaceae bacterium]
MKNTSISIRMDSDLKEKAENIIEQLGLNMTSVVNMLFNQIVREQAIPLSLSIKPKNHVIDDLMLAKAERSAGYVGRSAESVANDMERVIAEFTYEKI